MFTASTETITTNTEKTTFTCDRCAYSSRSEEQMLEHYGEKHAVKATKYAGDDLKLFFLETEEDYKAWTAYLSYDTRVRRFKWRGTGWYSVDRWTGPCPKGCCTDRCVGTEFAEDLLAPRREEIREKAVALRELKKLLEERP